jgi:hypothetical protein
MTEATSRKPLIQGCTEIGKYYNRSRIWAWRQLQKDGLPGTFKMNGQYYLDESMVQGDINELRKVK